MEKYINNNVNYTKEMVDNDRRNYLTYVKDKLIEKESNIYDDLRNIINSITDIDDNDIRNICIGIDDINYNIEKTNIYLYHEWYKYENIL